MKAGAGSPFLAFVGVGGRPSRRVSFVVERKLNVASLAGFVKQTSAARPEKTRASN